MPLLFHSNSLTISHTIAKTSQYTSLVHWNLAIMRFGIYINADSVQLGRVI